MVQDIKIRGSNDEYRVMEDVYPYLEGGILFVRIIVVNDDGEPTHFLCTQPQDILTRLMPYSAELMRDVREAGRAANVQQAEYIEKVEEEMRVKAEAEEEEENGGHTDATPDVNYG